MVIHAARAEVHDNNFMSCELPENVGRCVAGKKIEGGKIGGWIRPVSARQYEEISDADRRYEDGHTAGLLDIISVPMLEPKPSTYQSENHLIADQFYWRKLGRATWQQIEKAVDNVPGPLWLNGYSSSSGFNDRIPEDEAAGLTSSLTLIKPKNLRIRVAPKGDPNAPERRSVRAQFSLNGNQYDLGLTDAEMERMYRQGKKASVPIADALLCISLGEPFKGYAYKLVAALITPDRVGQSE